MAGQNNPLKKSLETKKHTSEGNYRYPIKGIMSAETQLYGLGIQNWAKNMTEGKKQK